MSSGVTGNRAAGSQAQRRPAQGLHEPRAERARVTPRCENCGLRRGAELRTLQLSQQYPQQGHRKSPLAPECPCSYHCRRTRCPPTHTHTEATRRRHGRPEPARAQLCGLEQVTAPLCAWGSLSGNKQGPGESLAECMEQCRAPPRGRFSHPEMPHRPHSSAEATRQLHRLCVAHDLLSHPRAPG